jgi:2-polyprenyl-3-methyl-5-hydroxy-6-metoxy-1,4-benzoquinol methylase
LSLSKARSCPLCGGRPARLTFPYVTLFNDTQFDYLKCGACKSVYVDPVPDAQTFALMYAKSGYHDCFYGGGKGVDYSDSVRMLRQYLAPGATVLDYGCGLGGFLKACGAQDLVTFGVEFDDDAALFAAKAANCEVFSIDIFSKLNKTSSFDAIHLGDVLEHLPDPAETLSRLLDYLRPGGVLFIEGPLEINPSPVFWVANIFGMVKRILKPNFMPHDPPTHLFRTGANSQKAFFMRLDNKLNIRYWQVFETGWPYLGSGGWIKRRVAALAVFMSGRQFFGFSFGNRFTAILVKK